ncbi:pentapeptide repeat-containing protein [Microbacterium sp. NPDC089698]|uniref:pentapeptide repeat-containing protein n=1 Tax=Microbacterium sp. NPDC089698 TaxID=3364200 RepID=UPI00382044C7
MARSTERPQPPRVSPPDLPDELDDGVGRRHGDHVGLRIPLTEDLAHAQFEQCSLSGAAERVDLAGATLLDVEIVDARTPVLSLKDATIRRLRIAGGRIGTLDLSGAHVAELIVEHARIDYLSLAAAKIQDSLLMDCTLATVDVPAAAVTRVRFERSSADEVDTRGLRADGLDLRGLDALAFLDVTSLRGATLTSRQVELLAPVFARAAGIDVQD